MAIPCPIRTRTRTISYVITPPRVLDVVLTKTVVITGKADTFAARITFKDNCFYTIQQTISAVLQLPGTSLARGR